VDKEREAIITMTADIVAAHVSNNSVAISDIPTLIAKVHRAMSNLESAKPADDPVSLTPAVPIRLSLKPDYIVCLEDGKRFKMLKRHLRQVYGLTPEQYRSKWGLPVSYPMVAPNYAKTRSALAVKIGLGRKPRARPSG
jgi:predicted transcriptional regulator